MKHKILKSSSEIDESISQLSEYLNKEYCENSVDIITLNYAADLFVKDLSKHLKIDFRLQTLKFDNYSETQKSGEVRITSDLEFPIINRHVIIADGIIISGLTHSYLIKYLKLRMPMSISLIAIGIKPNHLKYELPKVNALFNFNDEWVEGYGIGSAENSPQKCLLDLKISK